MKQEMPSHKHTFYCLMAFFIANVRPLYVHPICHFYKTAFDITRLKPDVQHSLKSNQENISVLNNCSVKLPFEGALDDLSGQ